MIFTSQKQCSEALGIPADLLRKAKAHPDSVTGDNGMHISGRIDSDKLLPWLEKHKEELMDQLQGVADDPITKYNHWRAIKEEANAKITQIELAEAEQASLNREDVKALLRKISTAQAAVLKSKLVQELPPKLLGQSVTEMAVTCEGVVREICEVFQREIGKWH